VPTTLDEMIVAVQKLHDPDHGVYGIALRGQRGAFDLIYVMTRGGPGITTETLDMYAFSQGFIESGRISYASSVAVLMMIATTVTSRPRCSQRALGHPTGTGANAGPGKPDQFQKVMSAASGDKVNLGRELERARYPALSALYPNVSWADCSIAAGACLLAAGGDTPTSARDQALIVPT
jgi:hypothetical protein